MHARTHARMQVVLESVTSDIAVAKVEHMHASRIIA